MTLLVVLMLVVCLGIPLALSLRLWRLNETSRLIWLLRAADATLISTLLFLLGRWGMAGYWLRPPLILLFLIALLGSWWRHRQRPWRSGVAGFWRRHAVTCLSIALFSAALLLALSGMLPPSDSQRLAFPLRNGRFLVAQGGGNTLLNHHAGHPEQRYAADITALYPAGFRARGLLPADPSRYAIFGAPLTSPCDGSVESLQDGLPDLNPPTADPGQPAGNHVVLACDGLRVELAHLRQGSVRVQAGQRVSVGTLLGEVGNSGNSSEPHLHIHAVAADSGEGVPIRFEAGYPYRNKLFVP